MRQQRRHSKRQNRKLHSHRNFMEEYAYHSFFLEWNTGIKIGFTLFMLVLCLFIRQMPVFIYLFTTFSLINIWKNRVNLVPYIKMLVIPIAFFVMAGIAIVFEIRYGENGRIYLECSKQSIEQGFFVCMRALTMVNICYFLILSTPIYEIIMTLRAWHVPNVIGELMLMIYRCVFFLLDTYSKMKTATEARMGYEGIWNSWKTFASTIGNLFIVSLKRSEQYFIALEARGYDGTFYVFEQEKPVKQRHIICILFYVLNICLIWIATIFYKFL